MINGVFRLLGENIPSGPVANCFIYLQFKNILSPSFSQHIYSSNKSCYILQNQPDFRCSIVQQNWVSSKKLARFGTVMALWYIEMFYSATKLSSIYKISQNLEPKWCYDIFTLVLPLPLVPVGVHHCLSGLALRNSQNSGDCVGSSLNLAVGRGLMGQRGTSGIHGGTGVSRRLFCILCSFVSYDSENKIKWELLVKHLVSIHVHTITFNLFMH